MVADRFSASLILRVISLDFDRTSVDEKVKMMSCHLVAKSHSLVPPLINAFKMSGLLGWGSGPARVGLLRIEWYGGESKCRELI